MTTETSHGLSRILPAPATSRLAAAVLTFGANVLCGRVLNVASPRGPLFVTWGLTFDCNAYCSFCTTHKLHRAHPPGLSPEQALDIADQIADAGTWVVGFTGGEVLMSPLLFPVVRRLKERGVVAYIVTNGLLLAEHAAEIVESGLDYVVVSLDSDDPREHDGQRRVAGLMDKALEGIERLRDLRGRRRRPMVKAVTMLTAHNLDRIGAIFDVLGRHADVVAAQPIVWGYGEHPHGRSKERLGELVFGPDERERVEAMLARAARDHPMLRQSYFRRIPSYWFSPEDLAARIPCWSPFLRLTINPEGQVLHCGTRFGMVGDLRRERLMDTWNGEEMRRQRETVRLRRNNCICWSSDTAFNNLMDRLRLPNLLPTWHRRQDHARNGDDQATG
ncbi:MAG: radical SAM protein [Alphaproteobacteria bacterium]